MNLHPAECGASNGLVIRVVPTLEQAAAHLGFQCILTEDEKVWSEALGSSWRARRPLPDLESFLSTVPDSYASSLRLVLACSTHPDFGPKTLPFLIIDKLRRWAAVSSTVPPSPLLKLVAFKVATQQKNSSFIRLISDVFEIHTERDTILPLVKDFLADYNYKTACQCAVIFNLHDNIQLDELLIPLLIQDKCFLIDDYLLSCPRLAPDFVKYLDELVRNKSIVNTIQVFLTDTPVPDVKWDKLHHKSIGKLIVRLCKKFNISPESCENLSHMRALGGIRFLVRQKYEENVISENAWNDLITDTITNNPNLLRELVCLLTPYDSKEALKWAKSYNLPKEFYPPDLITIDEEVDSIHVSSLILNEPNKWNTPPSTSSIVTYHVLSIPKNNIVIVNKRSIFESVILHDLSNVNIVGLDSEWKPSFGTKPSSVSLIQLATSNKVFIFDILALNNKQYSKLWYTFIERIFNNPNVIKIGFGLDNDMREITNSVPDLGSVKYKGLGYLELGKLWKNIINTGIPIPFPKIHMGEGLNSIVEQCFGACLNKNEQCSNWENRPLRSSQLEYAALDAFVLIEIYKLLSNLCLKFKLDFEEICYQIMERSEHSKTKKKRTKEKSLPQEINSLK